MSPDWQMALWNLALIQASVFVLWLLSLRLRDSSIADLFWGVGFILLAWTSYAWQPDAPSRSLLINVLVTVWGLRLSLYLLWRNHGRGEDPRYQSMRDYHGSRYWWVSLFTVFVLQGVILWIVGLPIQMAAATSSPSSWNVWDVCGVLLWSIGIFFETVGDWQLASFKSAPANRGKVMRKGLWRYTRHPNYFGDFCVWWGIYLIAAAGGAWWTVISPLIMSILLMRISGVTLLESTIQERRPEYADYRKTTNSFFPGFPKTIKRHVDE